MGSPEQWRVVSRRRGAPFSFVIISVFVFTIGIEMQHEGLFYAVDDIAMVLLGVVGCSESAKHEVYS